MFHVYHRFGLLLYQLLQATLERQTVTAPCGSDHKTIVVHMACGLLIAQGIPLLAINHFFVSTLQQTAVLRLKGVIFQDTCSCYSRTRTCSGRPDIAVCPVSYPHQLQLGCGRGQHPNSCITKTASHQAIQTAKSFAVCFHSSTSYEGYKLEFHFVLTAKQNLG